MWLLFFIINKIVEGVLIDFTIIIAILQNVGREKFKIGGFSFVKIFKYSFSNMEYYSLWVLQRLK